MRIALICHRGADLHTDGVARWLASFGELVAVVVLDEGAGMAVKRAKRERKRSGWLGLLDVVLFRAYYRLRLAARDTRWVAERLAALRARYPAPPAGTPVLHSSAVNSPEVERFLRDARPDVTLALCKNLLKRQIFAVPTHGTYVLHPGICPEYRNAHGCFWALAEGDVDNVGATMLRIDEGVDTGPVYGYFGYPYDEVNESHYVIQNRIVLDNLDAIAAKFRDIVAGRAERIDTRGRPSAVWGQPRLTRYLAWKRAARKRARSGWRAPAQPAAARLAAGAGS